MDLVGFFVMIVLLGQIADTDDVQEGAVSVTCIGFINHCVTDSDPLETIVTSAERMRVDQ